MHAITHFFLDLLRHAGLGGLFVTMTLANTGAPVGSEIILPAAGAFSAKGYLGNVWLVIAIAVIAELAGQSISYAIGRFGGRPFLDRYGKYIRFHHKEMDRVQAFFDRYGKFAIFMCRFIPVIRGIVGIAAGIAEMPLGAFYLWTLFGSAIFCGGLIWAGYALGEHADALASNVGKIALVAAVVVVVAAAAVAYVRMRKKPQASA